VNSPAANDRYVAHQEKVMSKSKCKADNDKARQADQESDGPDKGSIQSIEGQLEDIKHLLQETREEQNRKEELVRVINGNYIAASLIIAFGIFLLTFPIQGVAGVFANVSGDLMILGASLMILGTYRASRAKAKIIEFNFKRSLSHIYYKELWRNKPHFWGMLILYIALIVLFAGLAFGLLSLF